MGNGGIAPEVPFRQEIWVVVKPGVAARLLPVPREFARLCAVDAAYSSGLVVRRPGEDVRISAWRVDCVYRDSAAPQGAWVGLAPEARGMQARRTRCYSGALPPLFTQQPHAPDPRNCREDEGNNGDQVQDDIDPPRQFECYVYRKGEDHQHEEHDCRESMPPGLRGECLFFALPSVCIGRVPGAALKICISQIPRTCCQPAASKTAR